MKLTALLWLIVLPVIVAELDTVKPCRYKPPPCNDSNIKQLLPTIKESRAIQHIQISIVKQTTIHVNQKSISRQTITQKKLFCKLCACKQKHSSVVGRLTETDQIQIRDDTTSRACLRTYCYTGITTAVTTRIMRDIQPRKQRVPYSTFKYPLSNKQPCM